MVVSRKVPCELLRSLVKFGACGTNQQSENSTQPCGRVEYDCGTGLERFCYVGGPAIIPHGEGGGST
jgi:hypothetical protein